MRGSEGCKCESEAASLQKSFQIKKKQTGRTRQKSNPLVSPVSFHQTKRHNAFFPPSISATSLFVLTADTSRCKNHGNAEQSTIQRQFQKKKKKKNMNKLLNGIAGYVTQDPSPLLQLEGEQEAGSKNLTSGGKEVHLEKKYKGSVHQIDRQIDR